MEESGMVIALHGRRVSMVRAPEGEEFVNDELKARWVVGLKFLAYVSPARMNAR